MSFGETLYNLMYELLSPFGMESSDADRNAWALFPFGDLTEADKAGIQRAFEEKLQGIVAYLSENGLTIADLTENGAWKSGNEDFIGLLSQLAESMNATYDSTAGALVFSADGSTNNGVFPFMAVASASVTTGTTYLVNGSTLSAIADAIRAKAGTTDAMTPSEMPEKIASIQVGGSSGGYSTIDEIMAADGYENMLSRETTEEERRMIQAATDELMAIAGNLGYGYQGTCTAYYNPSDSSIRFVFQ